MAAALQSLAVGGEFLLALAHDMECGHDVAGRRMKFVCSSQLFDQFGDESVPFGSDHPIVTDVSTLGRDDDRVDECVASHSHSRVDIILAHPSASRRRVVALA